MQRVTGFQVINEFLGQRCAPLLESEGLIRSEHGVGTFVAESGLDPDALQLASFGETNEAVALEVVLRRVGPRVHAPDAARLLQLSSETRVVVVERLRLLDGQPIVHQQSFLPPSLAGIADDFRPDVSLYRQLQEQFGERAVASREVLQPINLSIQHAALLALPVGTPAFRSCRLTLNLHNRPLVYDEAVLVGSRWMLVGDRLGRQGDWGMRPGGDVYAALASLADCAIT